MGRLRGLRDRAGSILRPVLTTEGTVLGAGVYDAILAVLGMTSLAAADMA